MRGIARIRYEGGMLILPALTPYDRQEVFGALEWCVGQHARVRLELNGGTWLVRHGSSSQLKKACRACDAPFGTLVFMNGARNVLCGRCVPLLTDQRGAARRPPAPATPRTPIEAKNSVIGGAPPER